MDITPTPDPSARAGEPSEKASPGTRRIGHKGGAGLLRPRPPFLAIVLLGGALLRVGVGRLQDEGGQARSPRVVVGAEPLVAHVRIGQATVDVVGAIVEPPADKLAVRLGDRKRTRLN